MSMIDRHSIMIDKHEKRLEFEAETNKQLKKVGKVKPLFQKLEEEFEKEVQEPALEARKKKLAEIRNFSQPIDKEQLDKHDGTYIEKKKKKLQEIKNKREKEAKDLIKHFDNLNYNPNLDDEMHNKNL